MTYNLTQSQREVLQWMVKEVRDKLIPEEFLVYGTMGGTKIRNYQGTIPQGIVGALRALANAQLVLFDQNSPGIYRVTLLGQSYIAVDSNFDQPDDSFVRHLTPLAHTTRLDAELRKRCFSALAAGPSRSNWDTACRNAGVVLEERLHDVGNIKDKTRIGRDLVNDVFGDKGTLAAKFSDSSERLGHRDLYAGVVGVFRNPSAHHFVDPTPEEGGAYIVFVDLLLKKLEALR